MAIVASIALIVSSSDYVQRAMLQVALIWFVAQRLLHLQFVQTIISASAFLEHVHWVDINDILNVIFLGNRETLDRFSNCASQVGGVGGLQQNVKSVFAPQFGNGWWRWSQKPYFVPKVFPGSIQLGEKRIGDCFGNIFDGSSDDNSRDTSQWWVTEAASDHHFIFCELVVIMT